ncbi:MAG: hypothetical protein IT522_14030 [Burkholderiales bacterium]|nr:hypothetical protein [Burkholderiales bacterium]
MRRQSISVRVAASAAVALGLAATAPAHADCKALFDAMAKARGQQREASFVVDDDKAAPVPGDDFVQIRIGKVVWMAQDGKHFERSEVGAGDPTVSQMLADLDRAGRLGCETLGPGTYRGAAVIRYRHNNPIMTRPLPPQMLKQYGVTDEQVRKIVVYVDKASGLPVYSESFTPTGMKVGTAMIYGDAVQAPAVGGGNARK